MSTPIARSGSALARRLAFFKGLQGLNTRIHDTSNIDEIIFEVSTEVCALFGAERMTIYVVDDAGNTISSRVKTGLHVAKSIRLPISDKSVAGFCAQHRRMLNIRNVYDGQELQQISDSIEFRREVDERSGFHCQQMLVAPLVHPEGSRLLGVIQLMNTQDGEPFSSVEEEGVLALAQTLAIAFAQRMQATVPLRSKYHQLVLRGRLSDKELDQSAEDARTRKITQESVLVDDRKISLAEVGEAMAAFYGVPYEPFRPDRIKPMDLLRNIKREYAIQNGWLPLEETQEGIIILAVDPEQVMGTRVVLNVFQNARLVYRVTTRAEFEQTVGQYFDQSFEEFSVGDLLSDLADGDEAPSAGDELSAAADNELVKLVNRIIIDAYRQGASDIHIEPRPGKEKMLVRFRKDGLLVPYVEVPAAYRNPMVARIKIMCDLDISERRKPQDGKIKFRKYGPLDVELRVATIPTAGGLEDVVMRLLTQGEPIPIDKLALSDYNLQRLTATVTKPYGLFFVCGPTGSGKTTTLHSLLKYINKPETKIWTAEDPVEITQRGLRQVQVNRKAGLNFPTVMRAFLRADPDVIMVGEMRDAETVQIAIEASLTGHMVFSTLHTNSAPESAVRLLDMGMDPFNFADALLGVLAQRLARRLCKHCRAPEVATDEEITALLDEYCEDLRKTRQFREAPGEARSEILADWHERFADEQGRFVLFRPTGCPECSQSGYRGRIGLHELMLGSDAIRRQIQTRALVSDLLVSALEEGMRTLRQDGIQKVLSGDTDMAQVRRVCIR
ncbi:ATPase, T2SS/T4P/T4SS family [Uliginosibacterium sp. 31-16]|uniref:GspE/PulE family protein n=1 Tax=Uliginosibacterium sp. 31-16 TaxID=3068315 RepID=UPI00273DE176|nr:ATPase, T2SS/T4P/T4SS family [Uliginosibacterium sp. 31-16]MDP5240663.1 ATPase, T2SS/T4P/T4SS family [Uliginosibacterium sp. 31-16]